LGKSKEGSWDQILLNGSEKGMATGMKITLTQTSPTGTQSDIRGHKLLCDRPTEKGGGDTGPLGGEHFLFGLAGCFSSNLLGAIPEHDSPLAGIQVDVEATFAEDNRISAVNLKVSAAEGDKAALERCVAAAEANCILVNTLRSVVDITSSVAM